MFGVKITASGDPAALGGNGSDQGRLDRPGLVGRQLADAQGAFDEPVLLALDHQVEEARRAGRDGAPAAALGAASVFSLSSAWMVRTVRTATSCDRPVVDLHSIDALGIDALDAERLLAADADR